MMYIESSPYEHEAVPTVRAGTQETSLHSAVVALSLTHVPTTCHCQATGSIPQRFQVPRA